MKIRGLSHILLLRSPGKWEMRVRIAREGKEWQWRDRERKLDCQSASFHTSILFSPSNSMLQEMESKCLPHPRAVSHCFYQVNLTLTTSSLEREGYCGLVEWVKATMLSPALSSCQHGYTIMHGLQNPFGIVSSQNYVLLFFPHKSNWR